MFSLKDLDIISSVLHISSETESTILIIGIIVLLGWWIYSKSLADKQNKLDKVKEEYDKFYAPAYGLILSFRSGRMNQEEFAEQFRDHLIHQRSKASDTIICTEMEKWLSGQENLFWLEAILDDKCARMKKVLSADEADYAVSAVVWSVLTLGRIAVFGILIPTIVGVFLWIISTLRPNNWTISLMVLGGVSLIFVRDARKKHMLKKRKKELERKYEKQKYEKIDLN